MSTEVKPGYKQTEAGVIPEDWDAKVIGHDIDLLTGFPFPSSGYSVSGIRLLRGSNVKRGKTAWTDDITQYWPSVTPEISRYELRDGDLVIAMDGSLVGRSSAQLTSEDLPALLLQRVARIRSSKTYDVGYLAAFVKSDWFIKHSDAVKTVTAIPHISPADIRAFMIPAPPSINEQRAIAIALSDMETLITGLDQLIAKKRDIQQATMQQLLTGQRRLPGFSGEWEVKRLGDVCKITTGKKDVNEGNPSGQYPFFTCAREYTYSDNYSFECEAILVAGNGEVGNLNYYFGRFEAYQRTYVLYGFDADTIYIWHALRFGLAASLGIGKIGSSIPYIKKSDLTGFELPLPAPEEQAAIAATISDMSAELAALEVRRDKAREIKQGMMQELLTGKIRLG